MAIRPNGATFSNSSVDVMNAIRNSASINFRDRVPLATPDAESIRRIGAIFTSEGYTNEEYTQAMLEKEKIFNTYMGNFVALPHGVEEAKKELAVE